MCKRTFSFIILVLLEGVVCLSLAQYPQKDSRKGTYGYKASDGSWLIKPQFTDALSFSNGLAVVQTKKGLWGMINKEGEYVVKPEYYSLSKPLAGYSICKNKSSKFGMIDKSGSVVVPIEYDSIRHDFGMLYSGMKDGQFSYLINPASKSIKHYSFFSKTPVENIFLVSFQDSEYSLIDEIGYSVCDYSFLEEPVIKDDTRFFAKTASGTGLFSWKGEVIVKPVLDSIVSESGWYYGHLQDNGMTIVIADSSITEYDYFGDVISNGVRLVKRDGLTGFLNSDCMEMDMSTSELELLPNGMVLDRKHGLYEISDKPQLIFSVPKANGCVLTENVIRWSYSSDNSSLLYDLSNGKCGIIIKGQEVWAPRKAKSIMNLVDDVFVYSDLDDSLYHIFRSSGKEYDMTFSKISDWVDVYGYKDLGYMSCSCSPGRELLISKDATRLLLVVGDYNYNDYCSFIDLNSNLYGLINRKDYSIKEPATHVEQPSIPRGTRWLSGTFSNTQIILDEVIITKYTFYPDNQTSGHLTLSVASSSSMYRENSSSNIPYTIKDNMIKVGGGDYYTPNSLRIIPDRQAFQLYGTGELYTK